VIPGSVLTVDHAGVVAMLLYDGVPRDSTTPSKIDVAIESATVTF
jgi:hypothetical protein